MIDRLVSTERRSFAADDNSVGRKSLVVVAVFCFFAVVVVVVVLAFASVERCWCGINKISISLVVVVVGASQSLVRTRLNGAQLGRRLSH